MQQLKSRYFFVTLQSLATAPTQQLSHWNFKQGNKKLYAEYS